MNFPMKTGFSETDLTLDPINDVDNIACIIVRFMENGMKHACMHVEHARRTVVTREDIKRGFMLEVLLSNKRSMDDEHDAHVKLKQRLRNADSSSDNYAEVEVDEYEREEENDEFTLSNCKCAICTSFQKIHTLWEKKLKTQLTSVEVILCNQINNM